MEPTLLELALAKSRHQAMAQQALFQQQHAKNTALRLQEQSIRQHALHLQLDRSRAEFQASRRNRQAEIEVKLANSRAQYAELTDSRARKHEQLLAKSRQAHLQAISASEDKRQAAKFLGMENGVVGTRQQARNANYDL